MIKERLYCKLPFSAGRAIFRFQFHQVKMEETQPRLIWR